MDRRNVLKALGLMGMVSPAAVSRMKEYELISNPEITPKALSRKLTAIVLGAGGRGNVYGNFAHKFPDQLDIVGVAEPIPIRISRFSEKHNIPANRQFVTWEDVFKVPKFADIIIVTTPDDLHYGPAMQALEMGYDMLLEKPIAQTWEQCNDILQKQKEKDAIVAVCHVLRYSPYYKKIKEVIDSGVLGKMVSVQHFEPIEHTHMAHSYVRGNWHKESMTNPIILAKSCHDLDILRWWIGKECKYLSSFGSLSWFKPENAPVGATKRCTDGCAVESTCPYSAIKEYHTKRHRIGVFDLPDDKSKHGDVIMEKLKTTNYGKCVYHCENDVLDHQVVSMEFEDGITVNFNMEAFTNYHGRRTRIFGSLGHIYGDETDLYIADFEKDSIEHWNVRENVKVASGHGGGDWGLVADFLQAVDKQDVNLLTSNLDASMESHLMGFLAEESRKEKVVKEVRI